MTDDDKKINEFERSMDGCLGDITPYSAINDFLTDCFLLNDQAQQNNLPRFSVCMWGHAGIGKCVSGDTLVKTQDGTVEIASLFDGIYQEGVYDAPDGLVLADSNGFSPVESLYYSGDKSAIRIKTNFGRRLTGSMIHPVRVLSNEGLIWVKLFDMKVGDFVAIKGCNADVADVCLPSIPDVHPLCKMDFKVPKTMNPDLAYVIGAIIGEGDTISRMRVGMVQSASKPIVNNYKSKFKKVFGIDVKTQHDKRTKDTTNYVCYRKALRNWMGLIGVDYSYSRDKSVPWSVLASSLKSQRAFLKALYEAEGSNEAVGISISSSSKILLEQVSFMLLQWDIESSLSSRTINDKQYWSLLCSGDNGRKLNVLIGFSRSNGKWTKITNNSNLNKGGIPAGWAVSFCTKMKKSHLKAGGKLTKKAIHSAPLNRLYNPKHLSKTVSWETVDKWVAFFKKADKSFFETL